MLSINGLQVLVCTSTLAWGVNFPAHLVVVKGTEFFDGKTQRYVDFPITDVLQVSDCGTSSIAWPFLGVPGTNGDD